MTDGPSGGKRGVLIAALVGLLAVAGIVGFLVLSNGDGETAAGETGTTVADEADDGDTDAPTTTVEGETATTVEDATTTTEVVLDDADIRTEVLEAISFAGGPLEVEVVDGSTTITGTVFDETLEADAIAAAEGVAGVTDVVDNIDPLAEEFRCTDEIMARDRWVCITDASFDGTTVTASLIASEGTPWSTNGGFHFHVFAGNVDPETAGVAGNGIASGGGSWQVWDQLPEFTGSPGQIGGDADIESICIRVATDGHGLDSLDSGNCWPVERPEG